MKGHYDGDKAEAGEQVMGNTDHTHGMSSRAGYQNGNSKLGKSGAVQDVNYYRFLSMALIHTDLWKQQPTQIRHLTVSTCWMKWFIVSICSML